MRTNYQRLVDNPEPPALTPAEQEIVGKYLWSNFNKNFDLTNSPSPELLRTCLKRCLYNQGANFQEAPAQLLSYMSVQDLQYYATHLYVWIQLSHMLQDAYQGQDYLQAFQSSPYFQKAFEQTNPYILRYHVFALHNKIHNLITTEKNVGSADWQNKKTALNNEVMKTQEKIAELASKHPALAHFLSGYCHYSLAMVADGEQATQYWGRAYTDFLSCEAMEKKYPRASFIVNLGKVLYKNMPYENLSDTKEQIVKILGPEKTQVLAIQLSDRLQNK